ncbi:MAG: UDP-glucose 4-epimerase GalE [Microcystis viridis Mv_BB_P_19951000_S69]|uniref:UDP-glucose 4-epimerase n=1 Tax=Microcystis viridis Mv_BB_P_19951000_S68D TaxID=2486270 RepID=A0A552I134_MICVR|nr:UDP-glucose 4-epimerase GalE [Microcystis aeruginosa LG13-11]TRU73285.1 MAG: UDP-glucose 4-epimerase GalE [Microcystis viridis Mv_BB_P_19951000_S68]TRU76237.1 MAG: UDP-glucose 4-epimerase GalE [Microcystis viridis Mv_BB_P_19951000_S69]TRU77189.1 MAG: UDP-glucose 4-epimerase GalE [Microcystis viridis Mv_BB_P_19951000_S68D]TRU88706.1 MAG: UDP-glucose 4-epimerase GalE [Microcystis viridis Mv_BB_P_19951000_S69D]
MSQVKPTILVTGGAGYIGSHAVLALKNAGYSVIVLDNLSYGHAEIIKDILKVELIVGDTRDRSLLDNLFASRDLAAVMHFAAFIAVGESVQQPAIYYQNNVSGSLTLLQAMIAADVKKFVFSSTCAIYGMPKEIPMTENHPHHPLSPYAASKEMVEQILRDFDSAYGLKSVAFRYFNASGADPSGLLGEDHQPETHLIPLALLTALKKRDSLSIFGTDYDTPDGTAVRDYIHVNDLAQAHVLGLEYLLNGGESNVFNLGNGNGFSVREVIETAQAVTGLDIPVIESPRRAGDAPILIGSSDKAKQVLGWHPQYADLKLIVEHAWNWHQKRHA